MRPEFLDFQVTGRGNHRQVWSVKDCVLIDGGAL